MRVRTQAFHVPKRGNAETEYEDACFPDNTLEREVTEFRCAIADGASESAFANVWARLLVRSFGRRRLRLGRIRRLWQRAISGQPLPWYLETKIRFGAHAAFVGLSIRDGSANGNGQAAKDDAPAEPPEWLELPLGGEAPAPAAGSWRALAVGDSCLFHVRDGELLTVGPVIASDQFDNTPTLLSSKSPLPIRRGAADVNVLSGDWQPGDNFYLATDALAQWLLAIQEAGRPPWVNLGELCAEGDTETFNRLVAELRELGDLHNDDTTLLRVEVAS
jgi:hypothetical protein